MGLSAPAIAITNIESRRAPSTDDGVGGQFRLTAAGKTGNTDKHSLSGQLRLDRHQGATHWFLIGSSEYGESNGQKNTQNNFAHLRRIATLSDDWAWEIFAQYQDDAFRLLDARSLVGTGLRRHLIPDTGEQRLAIGAGAYYTREVYDLTSRRLQEDYARGNAYLSLQLPLNAQSTLSNITYLQPRLDHLEDFYAYNDLSLQVNVAGSVSLRVALESRYDSHPVADVETTDHSYTTALVIDF